MTGVFLVWRNLISNKTRFALSVAGVALALMLVLILAGFRTGLLLQITAYLRNSPGSIVVAQSGVSSFFGVSSLLPAGAVEDVRRMDRGARIVPILTQSALLTLHEKRVYAFLIGYDPALGGGPWRLAGGREPRQGLEVVIDRKLARQHGMAIGDALQVGGLTFPVVGLSEGTASWMTSLVFIRRASLEQLMPSPDLVSYLLIAPSTGVAPAVVQQALRRVSGIDVWTKGQMIAADLKTFAPLFAPITLMTVIAFAVGTLLIGLVAYTDVIERRREYGVLKAVGAGAWRLYRVVAFQATVVAALGVAVGMVLAYGVAQLIMRLRPQFLVSIAPSAFAVAFGLGMMMAILAALLPGRLIAALPPAEVFRR